MTLEKRIVFTVQDIKHIRVTCRGCERGLILSVRKATRLLHEWP